MEQSDRKHPDQLLLARPGPTGRLFAAVVPGQPVVAPRLERASGRIDGAVVWKYRLGEGGTELVLSSGADLDAMGALEVGPSEGSWRLETESFRVAWPYGWDVRSSPAGAPFAFLLAGAAGAAGEGGTLFFQGPMTRAPTEAELTQPGQTPQGRGAEGGASWVELGYEHGGAGWRQRHWAVPLGGRWILATGQAPAERAEPMRAALSECVAALQPV